MTRGAHRRNLPRRRLTRLVVAGASAAVVLIVAATAVNAFLTLGAGAGQAGSAAALTVALNPGSGASDLKPGGRGRLRLTVTNSAEAPVNLGRLVLDTTRGTGGFSASGACPTSAFTFAAQDNGGSGWTVPGRADGVDGSLVVDLPGSVTMSPTAPDSCQGASVTVFLAAQA